ncbi:hypothetical protein BJV77DRAFT_974947 [Russula vinacea]|nr:hypothetical protein BJV77DRAFT_974947 [Russula vinacea]
MRLHCSARATCCCSDVILAFSTLACILYCCPVDIIPRTNRTASFWMLCGF